MESRPYIIHSGSVDETRHAAARLASLVEPGMVIALDGDLGAGKTHFVQGFAQGLGVQGPVTSPTFNVMTEYAQGRLPLYHFDLYRLEDALELEDIAFYDVVEADGVSCIEWARKFEDEIPSQAIWLSITVADDGSRCLSASACDAHADQVLRSWTAHLACS